MISPSKNAEPLEVLNSDLKSLAGAKSLQNQNSNRIWIFSATVTLIVFSVKISDDNSVQFLGFNMNAEMFYPISATILVLVNIVYASSHIQANKAASLFHSYLIKIDAHNKFIADGYTIADAAHVLHSANINRIFPLANKMPNKLQPIAYLLFKMTADILLALVPACGLLYALYNIDQESIYFSILSIVSAVSLLATMILLFTTMRYTFGRFVAHWR